jgi:predicted Zn finger-like uncharacterized protein
MKIACPTCQAKYKLADEKVVGRTVKIRCKGCSETFVVTPVEPPAPVDVTRTGERNEASVLFSLAALTLPQMTHRAPVTPPSAAPVSEASSGLVDMRSLTVPRTDDVHLGGLFAPVLAPPVLVGTAPPEPARANGHVWMAAGLFALACAVVLSALYVGRTKEAAQPARAHIAAVSAARTPDVEAETARPTQAAHVVDTATVAAVATTAPASLRAATTARPEVSATATTHPVAAHCCPGETDAACEIRRSVGAACGDAEHVAPFDRAAAARALGATDITTCKRPNGPTGSGHVTVTFDPNGTASTVDVDTPTFAATPTGRCIAQAYRSAKVPPFSGSPLTVGKTFSLN